MNRKFNIAIIGLGNIGSYLYTFLKQKRKILSKKARVDFNISHICDKKRKFKVSKNKWLKNYLDAPKIKEIDLIVELIGGAEGSAKKLVFSALKNKKHVVTANKALIAKYGNQLAKIAEKNKVNLEYEAAVCGGIPVIRSIKDGLITNQINKVYGIFNGTTNFILSSMDFDKLNFDFALKKAQKLGYAERNPKADLAGFDVADKLRILSALCFNSTINYKNIYIEGINNIDQKDVQYSNLLGFKIKLLGLTEKNNNTIVQKVFPALVKSNSSTAKINGVLNNVILEGKPIGSIEMIGEGAGPKATVSAISSDIISVMKDSIKLPFNTPIKEKNKYKFRDMLNESYEAYLRFDLQVKNIGLVKNIIRKLKKNRIHIQKYKKINFNSNKFFSLIIITKITKDPNLRGIIKNFKNKKIYKCVKFIRIEKV
ncbi:MAG: hypothetical protein CBD56_00095 [Candidatus Pelagibacter sp. TMED196]|nr:MAG: hypothetical protein CBD56_00095 [Candidatus Pelagibacter sp. TMED196]|tara:strand:+ start:123 stop:1403 length:1281 start_codon:yes stop_codon:yes gene_type:complete